jgi:hypothetical protein
VERAPIPVSGSRRETWLVMAVSIGLIVLVSATLFLVADTGTAAAVLTGASVLVAVVALVVAYAATVTARSAALAGTSEATLARLDATAPVVTLRLCDVLVYREDDGGVRLEATMEFANHGTTPAVVRVGQPSLGHVRDRGRQPLPPAATLPVRLTHRATADEVRAGLAGCGEHRYGWSGAVPATVESVLGTVADELRLTFRLHPFLRTARGTWTWSDAIAEHDGYARLLHRDYRAEAVSG